MQSFPQTLDGLCLGRYRIFAGINLCSTRRQAGFGLSNVRLFPVLRRVRQKRIQCVSMDWKNFLQCPIRDGKAVLAQPLKQALNSLN